MKSTSGNLAGFNLFDLCCKSKEESVYEIKLGTSGFSIFVIVQV